MESGGKKPKYRKMRCDIPGLESIPPLPPIQTELCVDKYRWKNSKMWRIGVSTKRKIEQQIQLEKQVTMLEEKLSKRVVDTTYKGVIRSEEYYERQIERAVMNAPVTTLSQRNLQGILSFVPIELRTFAKEQGKITEMIEELRSQYEKSSRLIRARCTLKSKRKVDMIPVTECPIKHINEAWKNSCSYARNYLERNMHIYHPLIIQAKSACHQHLKETLLKNISFRAEGPLLIEEFQDVVASNCIESEFTLMQKSWWPQIGVIFSNEAALSGFKGHRRLCFLNCINIFITLQVTDLLQRTLKSLVETFHYKENVIPFFAPLLNVTLKVKEMEVVCEPSYQFIEKVFMRILIQINQVMADIQTMQCFLEEDDSEQTLKVAVSDDFLNIVQKELQIHLQNHYRKLSFLMQFYAEKFDPLITGKLKVKIDEFLRDEYLFEDLCELILTYKGVKDEVSKLLYEECLPIYHVNLSKMKAQLLDLANDLIRFLTDTACKIHRDENQRLCREFQYIKDRLLKEPETTSEMVELVQFLEDVREKKIEKMREKVLDSRDRLLLMLDLTLLTTEDMELTSTVLSWPKEVEPVFFICAEMLENSKVKFEDKLTTTTKKVSKELNKLIERVHDLEDNGNFDLVAQYYQEVLLLKKRISEVQITISWINEEEALFKLPTSSYPEVDMALNGLEPYANLYSFYLEWDRTEEKWMDGPFLELDADVIDSSVAEFKIEAFKIKKVIQNRLKTDKKKDAVRRDSVLDVSPPPVQIADHMIKRLAEFVHYIPAVAVLCNPGMRARHWVMVSEIVGKEIIPDSSTTFRSLIALEVQHHLEEISPISSTASREYGLEKTLQKMQEEWEEIEFTALPHRDSGTYVLSSVDEIQTLLDDQIVKTQAMRGSPFAKPFEVEIKAWEDQLKLTQDSIDEWIKVQTQWLYLEPIFSSADIMAQMPEEGRLFQQVDSTWRSIMKSTVDDPNVLNATSSPIVLRKLQESNDRLDRINKGLNSYLEKKRLYFPRFFFLSNDEMLEILSETKDPLRVQPHLKKCFEGIANLDFDDKLDIHGMLSSENEMVEFISVISTSEAKGQVEKWLLQVQDVMLLSVRKVILEAHEAYAEVPRIKWIIEWPGQVVLCVSQIYWTVEVHQAIAGGPPAVKDYYLTLQSQLAEIVDLVRGKLSKQARVTLGALVVIDVHARDVVLELIENGK